MSLVSAQNVTFFAKSGCNGASEIIKVVGCTNLSGNTVKSVLVPKSMKYNIFKNKDCKGFYETVQEGCSNLGDQNPKSIREAITES